MAKKVDLIGKRIGNLLVLAKDVHKSRGEASWVCRCDCGNYRHVKTHLLTSGIVHACKNCMKTYGAEKIAKLHRVDLTGNRYGRLVALFIAPNKNNHSYWHCRCDCGNELDVMTYSLTSGNTKSCGCLHHEKQIIVGKKTLHNLTGKRFGKLVVDSRSSNDGVRTRWNCKCDCGRVCIVSSQDLVSGDTKSCGCLSVNCSGSTGENEIKKYIEYISNVEFSKQRLLENTYGRNQEIDMYNKELKIGIEYNGSAFHATKNSIYADKPKLYHQSKFLQAKKQGIHLINIFDVDWENNQEKIKMYLKSLFTSNIKIYARKCEIKSIKKELADEFTDVYHIQGHTRQNSINYGLYYNNVLCAVMSFGNLRLSKTESGQYELHRYCVKDGYTIIGGANKLLKAFERDYIPKYIRSYSDNDYFIGNIYERLGFKDSGQCTPRYYWYYHNNEIKRERCMLKHLKVEYPELLQEAYDNEASNKEDYVMIKLGARKVYRSGNTRWEKKYNI